MTRRRPSRRLRTSPLAVLVGLATVGAPAFATSGEKAAAPTCPRNVVLSGDSGLAQTIASDLAVRGIRHSPSADCTPVRVTVERRARGVHLKIEDGEGRIVMRAVATPRTAALLVESWLRTDIAAPLLAARPSTDSAPVVLAHRAAAATAAPVPPPSALNVAMAAPPLAGAAAVPANAAPASLLLLPPPPPSVSASAASPAVEVAARPVRSAAALTLAAEGAMSRDGSSWMGTSMEACMRVGSACVGIMGRYVATVRDEVTTLADGDRVGETCQGADGLVSAHVSIAVGRVSLRPGAAVGLGWIRASTTQTSPTGSFMPRHGTVDSTSLRAEGRLAIDFPLSRSLALDVAFSGGLGEGADAIHPTTERGMPEFTVSSSPALLVRGGIGFRYGGP
jgi:hypothetical protein